MTNCEVTTAKRKLLRTIDPGKYQMKQIKTLIRESDTHGPKSFGFSMGELMPEAVRRIKSGSRLVANHGSSDGRA